MLFTYDKLHWIWAVFYKDVQNGSSRKSHIDCVYFYGIATQPWFAKNTDVKRNELDAEPSISYICKLLNHYASQTT